MIDALFITSPSEDTLSHLVSGSEITLYVGLSSSSNRRNVDLPAAV